MQQQSESKQKIKYLHNLLDHEIQATKQVIDGYLGFQTIQVKLKQLEVKLGTIKQQNAIKVQQLSNGKYSSQKSQKKTKSIYGVSSRNSLNYYEHHTEIKRGKQERNQFDGIQQEYMGKYHQNCQGKRFNYQSPTNKKKKGVKKTNSEAIFANYEIAKRSTSKKIFSTTKKDQYTTKSKTKNLYSKSINNREGLRRRQPSQHHLNKTTIQNKSKSHKRLTNYERSLQKNIHNIKVVASAKTQDKNKKQIKVVIEKIQKGKLQSQLSHLKRQNQFLKSKVTELKKYERDYLKIADVLHKGQIIRKNR